ncbi:dehydrodolichyl diphosphate synthase complex subunit DHDDS-like [Lutzomyia longipalpis]|uniref:dehydrodolichyl diphosphate synthase complex subunit DHDDS-like n=1 Tax=Lutzomyia longipalpis TaxID=7200 RepID=UPI002483D18A|nr:dehydrodolichyl diphosphate synthase complex subunit DHDDS-like [Lutzomyia longipalpis]
MDGNRRYAREVNLPIGIAYVEGFNVMQRVLRWLYLLGVSEVTVFAFSMDNFRRSQSEISILKSVTLNSFKHMAHYANVYKEANVRFQVIGRYKMFPEEVKEIVRVAETETKDLNGMIFNFFAAYSSHDDIVGSIKDVCKKVVNNEMHPHDVNEEEVERNLQTNRCSKPDLLIRTSGETRLSNFLLWELLL